MRIGSMSQLANVCKNLGFPIGLLDTLVKNEGKRLERVCSLTTTRNPLLYETVVVVDFYGRAQITFHCTDYLVKTYDTNWKPHHLQTALYNQVERKPESWVELDTMRGLI